MKKQLRLSVGLVCILLYIPMLLSSQDVIRRKTDIPGAQLDTIAAYIETFPDHTQLSLALINDSVTSFLGFLKGDTEWKVVENRDSVFEIGSISKVFTSTLLVQMADLGLVDLDDPIAGITPYKMNRSGLEGKEITLKTLSNHTSGLPNLPGNLMNLVLKYPDNPLGIMIMQCCANILRNR